MLSFFTSLPTIPFKYSKNSSFRSGLRSVRSTYSTVASKYPVDFTKTVNFIQKTGGWNVKGAGNSKATKHTNTKVEAFARTISINQKSELIVHGKNGQLRERNSYGNDHYPPKG